MKKTSIQKDIFSEKNMQSSIDVILQSFWQLIEKVIRSKSPPAPWISAFTISFFFSLITLVVSIYFKNISEVDFLAIIFGGILLIFNLITARLTFRRTFTTLGKLFHKKDPSNSINNNLIPWFALARDVKRPIILAIIIYAINVVFVFRDPTDSLPEPETLLMGGVMLLWTGFMLYYMYLFILLPLKLRNCDFEIHKENPASSQILATWNRLMNFAAYMFAIMLAAGTLFTLSIAPFRIRTLFFIIPRWLLLIVLFTVNQITLSKIIAKSKRETLKEIEEKMTILRPDGVTSSREDLQDILSLWDYHDRLLKTRNSLLNFRGVIDFFNTLLIPILAFLLANLEEIRTFLNL